MKKFPDLIRRYLDLTPARRTAARYSFILTVITFSNYSFVHNRIPILEHNAFLPDAGVFLLYLWILLLLDEFLFLFQSCSVLAAVVGVVKRVSLAVIAIYAFAAAILAVNGLGSHPMTIRPARIATMSSPYRGSWNYGTLTVDGWDGAGGRREILLLNYEESLLYAGENVEVVLGRGALFLDHVLEVRQDWEKYYGKMLKAAPDSLVGLKGLVNVYTERGKFDEAIKWHALYAEKAGNDDVGINLARHIIDARQYSRAAVLIKEMIRTNRSYDNLYTLGYALAWAGEKEEAATYLKEATELDPADYRAFYSLGYVYRDTRQYDKARQAWETVLTLVPHFPEVEGKLMEVKAVMTVKNLF